MKAFTFKCFNIIFKTAIVICLVLVVAFAATMYRLKQSPLVVDTEHAFVKPFLDVGDGHITMKKLAFFFDGSLKARAGWVRWLNSDDEVLLSLDEVTFTVSNKQILRGIITPKSFEINGLMVDIEVLPEYLLVAGQEIPLKKAKTGKNYTNETSKNNEVAETTLLSFLNNEGNSNPYFSALESARITNAQVNFKDRVRFKQWHMNDGLITFEKSFLKGESLHFRGDILVKGEETPTPAHIFVTHQRNQKNLNIRFKIDDIDASYVDGYMPFTNPFTGRGRVEVETQLMDNNSLNHTSIKLTLGKGSTHVSVAYAFPFVYEKAELDVKFTVKNNVHKMDLRTLHFIDNTGLDIKVSGTVDDLLNTPQFDLKLTSDSRTTVEHLANYLPNKFIGGVVNWLNNSFEASDIYNLKLNYTGKPTELPFCLDKCGFDGSFDFENTTLKILKNPLTIKDASGTFTMKNGEIIIAPSGKNSINGQSIEDALIKITDHFNIDKPANITISGDVNGNLAELLSILETEIGDEKQPWNVKASGHHTSKVHINFPFENLTYAMLNMDIQSTVRDIKVPDLIPNVPIESDVLSLHITEKDLHTKGRARLAGYDASIQWREKMNNFANETNVEVAGHFPLEKLRPLIQDAGFLLDGDIPGVLKVKKQKDKKIYSFNIDGDLENTAIKFSPLNWAKPKKIPLLLKTTGFMDIEKGITRLDSLALNSVDVDIDGWVESNNGAVSLEFPKLDIAKHKLNISHINGKTVIGGMVLDMTALDIFEQTKSDENNTDSDIEINVEQLLLKNAELLKVSGKITTSADGTKSQYIKGVFPNEAAFLASYDKNKSGAATMLLKSDNADSALRALGLPSLFHKGSIDAKIDFKSEADMTAERQAARQHAIDNSQSVADAQNSAIIAMSNVPKALGVVNINKVNLKNAPSVVSLLSVLSLEQLLKNEKGVYFESIFLPLSFQGDNILFDNLIMKGPSIGVKMKGRINSKTKQISASGQLVPLRGVNNLISKIPLIGDILTGSQDGVLVADFSIKGTTDNPKISTNPFSVVTPGIVKDVFRVIAP